MSWAEVQRAERWFAKHGTFFVFLGRLLPTVRSLVSVPAGLLKMQLQSFMLASTLGTAGWTAMLAVAGYKLGENYEDIDAVPRAGVERGPGRPAWPAISIACGPTATSTGRERPKRRQAGHRPSLRSARRGCAWR